MPPSLDRTEQLLHLLKTRIAILDGAMGTEIQALALTEAHYRGAQFRNHACPLNGNYEVLSLTQPSLIVSLHRKYLESGADIITTNTFRANASSMAAYGLASSVYAINRAGAQLGSIARTTVGKISPGWPRFLAGTLSTPDASVEAYTEQVVGLIDGGVDLLLLETVFDTRNAIAALDAIESCAGGHARTIPIWISVALTERGRLPSGETVENFWQQISDRRLFAVGFNCSVGAPWIASYVEWLSHATATCVSCHPSAGLPDALGRHPDSPDAVASFLGGLASRRWLNIAGGCCGTGPEHIRCLRERLVAGLPRSFR